MPRIPHRRPFVLEAGESLLVTNDPVRCLTNHVATANALGVTQRDLSVSRISPMPLPINGGRPELGSSRRRIEGINPRSMWLPLMWLPPRLIERVQFHVVDGDLVIIDPNGHFAGDPRSVSAPLPGHKVETESTDIWTMRVALELDASGAYDADSGTWLDVLDTIGVNVDDVDDESRVQRWLEGGEDSELSELDASFLSDTPGLDQGEAPSWAFVSALSTYRELLNATWALSTDSMLDTVSDLCRELEDGSIDEPEEAKFIANMVCMLAAPLLDWYRTDEMEWWSEMSKTVQNFSGTVSDFASGPLSEIDQRLLDVRTQTWPLMESTTEKFNR